MNNHVVLQLLTVRRRLSPDDTGGRDDILFLHDRGNILCRHPQARHDVGLQPDSHTVIPGAKNIHQSDAGNAGQQIQYVQRGVVAEKQIVVPRIAGFQRDDDQRLRLTFHHRDALA